MSPAAELAGCACASGTAAAATLPAANMPCRKPRRSFVLESIVVVLAGLRLAGPGLYGKHAPLSALLTPSCYGQGLDTSSRTIPSMNSEFPGRRTVRYSYRSATIGSILVARRAGMYIARPAARIRASGIAVNV